MTEILFLFSSHAKSIDNNLSHSLNCLFVLKWFDTSNIFGKAFISQILFVIQNLILGLNSISVYPPLLPGLKGEHSGHTDYLKLLGLLCKDTLYDQDTLEVVPVAVWRQGHGRGGVTCLFTDPAWRTCQSTQPAVLHNNVSSLWLLKLVPRITQSLVITAEVTTETRHVAGFRLFRNKLFL